MDPLRKAPTRILGVEHARIIGRTSGRCVYIGPHFILQLTTKLDHIALAELAVRSFRV
jgi:hypothetical protein